MSGPYDPSDEFRQESITDAIRRAATGATDQLALDAVDGNPAAIQAAATNDADVDAIKADLREAARQWDEAAANASNDAGERFHKTKGDVLHGVWLDVDKGAHQLRKLVSRLRAKARRAEKERESATSDLADAKAKGTMVGYEQAAEIIERHI